MKKRIAIIAALMATVAAGVLAIGFYRESKTAENGNETSTCKQKTEMADIVQPDVTKTDKKPKCDYESFRDTAFLGNSRLVSLKNYNLAPNVYPVVGLDVRTVFTKYVDDSDVVVIDELDGRAFDKVILMFGDNECGWPNRDYFIEKYSEVIDAVKAKQPDAQIYLHSIIPVSSEASAKNECDCNNATISELNIRIRRLAEDSGFEYIDVPLCLLDEQGNLINEAASDGIHLNKTYSSVWMGYLEEILFK